MRYNIDHYKFFFIPEDLYGRIPKGDFLKTKRIIGFTLWYAGLSAGIYTALAVHAAKTNKEYFVPDYLIILGAWTKNGKPGEELSMRIARAARYMKENDNVIAIATGGCFRKGQVKSEAQVIKDALVALGIDESRIIMEDKSRNTYENFYNCQKIIENSGNNGATVGILTNQFHLLRAKKIAEQCGFGDAVMIGANSPKNPEMLYLRESVVIYEVLAKGLSKKIRKRNF